MDINNLLAGEQVAMMRADAGPAAADCAHEQEVGRIGGLLAASAYPHRPYRRRGTLHLTLARKDAA